MTARMPAFTRPWFLLICNENGPNHSLTDWAKLRNAYESDRHAAPNGAIRVD